MGVKLGYDQRDVRRCGRRVLVALWIDGKDLGDGCPFLWERDLADCVRSQEPAPSDELLDMVLRHFLNPSVGMLERSGKSRWNGLGLKLTPAGARLAKDYCERLKAKIGTE